MDGVDIDVGVKAPMVPQQQVTEEVRAEHDERVVPVSSNE